MPAAGRGLVCCLCGGHWSCDELLAHMTDCRRRRVALYRSLPPPFDESEVLNPRTLLARNLLPAVPVGSASCGRARGGRAG